MAQGFCAAAIVGDPGLIKPVVGSHLPFEYRADTQNPMS
jgi:hypothetical protein